MTYRDAANWAIENIPMNQFDSYEDWLDEVNKEVNTPELLAEKEFTDMLQRAWENTIGPIDKTKEDIEKEREEQQRIEQEQRRIEQFEVEEIKEPEIKEPTTKQIEHELERNLNPEQRSKDFLTQEKSGALAEVLKSLPKGSKISIPQVKGAPISIKPSVTFPTGITMTRPPIPVVRTPLQSVVGAFRSGISTVKTAVRTGIRVIFRI